MTRYNGVADRTTSAQYSLELDNASKWGYRHQQCFLLFLCMTMSYIIRSCMGVALVAMTDTSSYTPDTDTQVLDDTNLTVSADVEFTPTGLLNALLLVGPYPRFAWSKQLQDSIMSSFFWGYVLLQLPAGHLAHALGSRALLAAAMTITCVVHLLLPSLTYYGGWTFALIARFVIGLTQSCVVPCMHTLFGKWTPVEDRSRLAGFAYGGIALGPVIGLFVTGHIAASPLGWPGIFYICSILSGVLAVLVWCFVADSPAEHRSISIWEKTYIEKGLGQQNLAGQQAGRIPWASLLRCRGLHAIVVAHIAHTYGHTTLYTEVPAYMDKIMGVNIKTNGLLTALPFLVMWATNFIFNKLTDTLIVKNILSLTSARKFITSVGYIPAAAGLAALGFVPRDLVTVESLLVLICAFKVAGQSGFMINHIDISPNYAGAMMSVTNFTANACAALAPLVAGAILTDVTDVSLWRAVFCVTAGTYAVSTVAYVCTGTAERAPWDQDPARPEDCAGPMLVRDAPTAP